jgi:integrase
MIVVLWRAGLRIHEALALNESDLDHRRGALLVRRGKGGRRREVDKWAREHLQPWIDLRLELPVARCSASSTARPPDDHGRPPPRVPSCAAWPQPLAFADASPPPAPPRPRAEMAHEGVPLIVIQRQLGHSNLGITSIYLQGIDNAEIIEAVHGRRAPTVPVSVSLRL